jgi:hypothetical protein
MEEYVEENNTKNEQEGGEVEVENDENETEESDDCSEFEDDYELDLPLEDDPTEGYVDIARDNRPAVDETTQHITSWSKIGTVFVPPCLYHENNPNLDWALIEIGDQSLCRPNLFVTLDAKIQYNVQGELKESTHRPPEVRVIFTGPGGFKTGWLSTSSSFMMLSPGNRFVEMYTLTMFTGSGMRYIPFIALAFTNF